MNRAIFTILIFTLILGCDRKQKKVSEAQFQDYALRLLRDGFPGKKFEKTKDIDVIQAEGLQIGLTNLYRKYESDETSIDLEILNNYRELTVTKEVNETLSWSQAKKILRPKINSKANLEVIPDLIYTELTTELILAYALDLGNLDRYVNKEDAIGWKKTTTEIHAISFENLDSISKEFSLETMGTDIITLTTNDTYDSARIFLPRLRLKLREKLGNEYRIGMPNRDLIVFWNKSLYGNAAQKLHSQISKDFKNMPYPLSEEIFVFKNDKLSEIGK